MPAIAFMEEEREAEAGRLALAFYRCVDVLLACGCLLIAAPLMLVICLAVRLDSDGKAIFTQVRLGRDKQPFTLHKFRTMRTEADPLVHREYVRQLLGGEEQTHSNGGGRDLYKLAADDRVTRVGRLLRDSSLD
ncbi:MAG TPA: sugar transferase, partial [Solirubrobacteraceae bacterium]|nr:sugar transferase [Solirubrobacteraceae bacterium]